MDKEQIQSDYKYLPSHLLDDDDVPTATSLKNLKTSEKEFAFSAPPILFNLGYRIEEDFFDDGQRTWESQLNSSIKISKKQKTCEVTQFQLQINNTRKLSLQNQEQYLDYQNYQNINVPPINYFPIYSPEQEILNNLVYVPSWCKDQHGSRNIQIALQNSNEYLKNKIFEYLLSHLQELIYDKFGNYVIQKYIDLGNEKQKEIIYQYSKREFLFISLHSYGCRVIQKIVDYASDKETVQLEIMKIIESHIIQIIQNQNGNHIIQKILESFNAQSTEYLSKLLSINIQKLSFHAFGCRVIQKYLQNGKHQQIKSKMMESLIKMAIKLSKCQFGNYIMQYIVSNSKQYQPKLLEILLQNFIELSCNKFASNVIEKAICSSKKPFSQSIIDKIHNNQDLVVIAKNQFGNYVIQSLLQKSSFEKKQLIKNKLKQNCQEISKSQYGRHVLMQMDKFK